MEGLRLMLIGMGVVFLFLFILVAYMKLVPIISKFKRATRIKRKVNSDTLTTGISNSNSSDENQKMKLNSLIGQISELKDKDSEDVSEVTVAAIAAAICAHSGRKPKQIVITSPTGSTQQINLWAAAGRQDIMVTRDMAGQVGFQY
jgi:Na+-transporting methylmalonyl-CoA/oxaloacetate decarboxylase gamma subunit